MDKHTFSATTLKYLAIIAMTVDHIAFAFVPATSALCYVMRLFGRLTAPLMCFFLSEGYRYTRNRKNYLLRLFAFAIISQPPYFYLVFRRMPNSIWECITHLNVMFTLGIALLTLMILQSRRIKNAAKAILAAVCISLAQFGDWSYMIPTWVLIFYYFKQDTPKRNILYAAACLILLPMIYLHQFNGFAHFSFQYGTLLALLPLQRYNGQRNIRNSNRSNRWFFYLYYPLHVIVLDSVLLMNTA